MSQIHVERLCRHTTELQNSCRIDTFIVIVALDELKVLHTGHRYTSVEVQDVRRDVVVPARRLVRQFLQK